MIRYATAKDIDALHQLERLCNPSAWSVQQLQGALTSPTNTMIIDEYHHTIIAMLLWQQVADDIEIHLLNTHPDFQRQGKAKQLLQYLCIYARQQNVNRLLLEVRASNHVALHLYQHLNFIECGRRHGYYTQGDDAILMEKLC